MNYHPFVQRFGQSAAAVIQRCILIGIAIAAVCAGATANAQYTLTTLATFNGANGQNPVGILIADANGNLYGTTSIGGAEGDGTVFEMANDANHTLTTLATFNGTNGSDPNAGLIADATGNLYGTTFRGGAHGMGTVFEVANDANHTLTTLATFNGANGQSPRAGLIADAIGNLYGTTGDSADDHDAGVVFEVAAGTHALTTLVRFPLDPYGLGVNALIADASGNLYGTTFNVQYYLESEYGGALFKVANDANHTLSTLAVFNVTVGGRSGRQPVGSLIADASGNLYGVTRLGGTTGNGAVFEVANGFTGVNHPPPTTLVSFHGTNGSQPEAGLIMDASGNLYGTTLVGGDLTLNNGFGGGTVFEMANDANHTLTTLATFNGANGLGPEGSLLADASGNFYGTTEYGGDLTLNGGLGDGTVFELSPVPEPSSLALGLLAMGALGLMFHDRKT
jgi:uncharacterized repeat protein (TIGR03803 family)